MTRAAILTGQGGFTLLELLVVVLILSAIAMVALDSLQTDTNQVRHEDTRARLSLIRDAIIGPREIGANGQPVVAGFVADVGRLPQCLAELVDIDANCDDGTNPDLASPPEWQLDGATNLYAGWRGPYLNVVREISGLVAFRDGWGNDVAALPRNYGWSKFDEDSGALVVQSLGRDGLVNPGDAGDYAALALYEQDFPPTADASNPTSDPDPLIAADEHQVTLGTISVTLRNDTAADITVDPNALCLRVYYPDPPNIAFTSADSGPAPATATTIPAGAQVTLAVAIATPASIAWGRRGLQLVDYDGTTCAGGVDPPYNGHPLQNVTLLPQAAFPEIVWAAE